MQQFRSFNPLASIAGVQGIASQAQGIRSQRQGNQLQEILQPLKVQEAQAQGREINMDEAAREAQYFISALGDVDTSTPEGMQAAQQRWAAARQALGQVSDDVDEIPEQFDPQAYQTIQGIASQYASREGGLSADYISFQNMTKGMTPEERERARRIKLGLAPRATGSAALTITDSGRAGEVAETEATIAGAKSGAAEGAKLDEQIRAAQDKAFQEVLGKEGGQIYSKLQRAAQEASEFLPRLRGLKEMAAAANTGAYANAKMMGKRLFGMDVATDEALNAKLMGLAQDILNQQTGTKTDFDFQVAVEQAASMGKSPEANIMLINSLIDRQESALRFGDMAREAMQQGGPQAVLDLRFTPETSGGGLESLSDEQLLEGL